MFRASLQTRFRNLQSKHRGRLDVGGVEPKVSPTGNSSSEFDVFALSRYAYASRDVRACVRRRARDRSIGRDRSKGPEIRLRLGRSGRIFLLLVPCTRVPRPEDMAMFFLHVFCIRLQPYSKVLEDMERT